MTRLRLHTALLGALLLAGCGKPPTVQPPAPTATDVLMTIDGVDILFGEVEPLCEFLTATHPEAGRKTTVQKVLAEYVVPLRLAQRAFAAERQERHQRAMELCDVATNAAELEAANVPMRERKTYSRGQPQLPVAQFLFDPLMVGAVSPPIEVPRGWVVTAAHDYVEMPRASEDVIEATQVGYFTHTVGTWRDWFDQEKARLADQVTFVHPDYREALPAWCKAPTNKPTR